MPASLMNSGFTRQVGQESNLQPAVVEFCCRSFSYVQGAYTKGLKKAYFDGPKYVEVHQSSPALGSKLGSIAEESGRSKFV
jgi:hypothetical protein